MSSLTEAEAAKFAEIAEFLAELTSTGVWAPIPRIDDDEIQFRFWKHDIDRYYTLSDDAVAEIVVSRFRAVSRAIGGRWEKNDPTLSVYEDAYYTFTNVRKVGGHSVILWMERDMICERVPVGTEKVVVPAVEAQPEKVVERPVYVRECKPLNSRMEELVAAMEAVEA